MSADNHANYARIGFAVFIGLVATVLTLMYIGGVGESFNRVKAETYYDFPVNGLSVGSAVNFLGVKVGEVSEISFVTAAYDDAVSREDAQRIRIVMSFNPKVFDLGSSEEESVEAIRGYVNLGMRATVSANAITGLARVDLNIRESPLPPAELTWRPRHPLIPPQPSLLTSFSATATRFMDKVNRTDFSQLASNVTTVVESMAKVSANLSEMIEGQRAGFVSIMNHLDEFGASASALADELRMNPSLLLRPRDPAPLSETIR